MGFQNKRIFCLALTQNKYLRFSTHFFYCFASVSIFKQIISEYVVFLLLYYNNVMLFLFVGFQNKRIFCLALSQNKYLRFSTHFFYCFASVSIFKEIFSEYVVFLLLYYNNVMLFLFNSLHELLKNSVKMLQPLHF